MRTWTFIHTSWTLPYLSEESFFSDCWKVSSVIPVFKNVEERCTTKNYYRVSLLYVDSAVFEKLVDNRLVDHLEKYVFFTVVFDRKARALNRPAVIWAVAVDISKAYNRVCNAVCHHKLKY